MRHFRASDSNTLLVGTLPSCMRQTTRKALLVLRSCLTLLTPSLSVTAVNRTIQIAAITPSAQNHLLCAAVTIEDSITIVQRKAAAELDLMLSLVAYLYCFCPESIRRFEFALGPLSLFAVLIFARSILMKPHEQRMCFIYTILRCA